MKLKLDNFELRDLVDTGTPNDPQDPVLRIRIGNNEMMTKRSVDGGTSTTFNEMFEIEVDEYEYKDGKLEIEVEVVNVGVEQNKGMLDKNIHIGFGRATLHSVVPQFDNEAYFIIDLTHYSNRGNIRKGEVLMRGFLHDPEAIREALKFKTIELENLKTSYADYITSSTKLESDMEEELKKAEAKIQKLTKKNIKITETLTTVTNQYTMISNEFTMIQQELHLYKNDPTFFSDREKGLLQDLETLRDEVTLLRQQNNAPKHDPDAERRERELRDLVAVYEKQMNDQNSHIRVMESELATLRQQGQQRSPDDVATIAELTEQVNTFLKELESLNRLYNESQQKNAADANLIAEFQVQITNLQMQINILQTSGSASSNEEIGRLQAMLLETKNTAAGLIDSWKKQYYEALEAGKVDKDRLAVLGSDLGLTRNNVERVSSQLREQQDVNVRLLAIIKIYEQELTISAKQELPKAAQLVAAQQ